MKNQIFAYGKITSNKILQCLRKIEHDDDLQPILKLCLRNSIVVIYLLMNNTVSEYRNSANEGGEGHDGAIEGDEGRDEAIEDHPDRNSTNEEREPDCESS